MKRSIVCPFCNSVISIDENCKKIECQSCKKSLNFWDWNPCVWTAPVDIQKARANDAQLRGKRLYSEEIVLNPDNANAIDIEIDSAEKIYTVSPALIHKFSSSWFLTVNGDYNVFLNGQLVPKHAELNPLDSISILGVEMHLSSDGKIKAGKADFGVKNIELKNISASLGSKTLSIDDITISAGEFVGILGPSGCGKSSLIEIMVGLRRNVYGEYLVNGKSAASGFENINFAYVPQDIALHNKLTLNEEISCFQQINVKTPVTPDTVERLLRKFGLDAEVNNATGNLSGGQRRRAGIMMELLNDPAILFMDEPTAGLDPKFESIVMSDLKALSQQGRIVICSTHIMENINLFDKVIFMNKNAQLEFFGSPAELLKKYNVSKTIDLYDTEPSDRLSIPVEKCKKIQEYRNYKSWGIDAQDISGYLKRTFLQITKINLKELRSFVNFLFTHPISILLLQPVIISVIIHFACASDFCTGWSSTGFYLAIVVFWLGMNNAVRELVRERIPIRCLERLRGVKLGSYLFAKIFSMCLLCLMQVLLFYGSLYVLFILRKLSEQGATNAGYYFSWSILSILVVTCITGGFVGLAVSAFNKEENIAICYLPLIIIPVLFFSNPIVRDENYQKPTKIRNFTVQRRTAVNDKGEEEWEKLDGTYSNLAVWIEGIMPCYSPQVLIGYLSNTGQENKKNIKKASMKFLLHQFSYIAICCLILCYFQNKREKEWGGR